METALHRLDFYLGFIVIVLVGSLTSLVALRCYQQTEEGEREGLFTRFVKKWDAPLAEFGGYSSLRLFMVSILALFLELVMIRWISAEIRVFAYLKNFVLIACFLGLGLGSYLCRRKINLLAMFVPVLTLAFLVKFPWEPLRTLMSALPSYLGASSEVQFFGIPRVDLSLMSVAGLMAATMVTVPIFVLICLTFIPLGQVVGAYLEDASDGVRAYTVNILGSLAGILLFTLLCFSSLPPLVWFGVAGLLQLLWMARLRRQIWAAVIAFALCILLVSLVPDKGKQYWSPYQKLTLTQIEDHGERVAYQLDTNNTWFQRVVDLSPSFVAAHPQFFREVPADLDAYNMPYRLYPNPSSVLVLGAGMGNDVAAALRGGASRIVAVEIDPLVAKLGQELHPERPYSSPRVKLVVNDARSYLQNSSEKFDLIVYSLLDSHTNVSNYSNIRIDNYVYTTEATHEMRKLLSPDGLAIVKFQVTTPWVAGRLEGLMREGFGRPPLPLFVPGSVYSTGGHFFVAGSSERLGAALKDPQLASYIREHGDFPMEKASLTTDEWPFFYQHEPGLPLIVIVVSTVLIALCWMLMRSTGMRKRSVRWHFFFMGAGFLLLETQIISRMALLFGTTWVVNSIAITVLLLLIVLANLLVKRRKDLPAWLPYTGIFVTMAISYFAPLHWFFFDSLWMKGAAATAVLCSPAFFASIVFIQSFERASFSSKALGSNLFGGLVGGLLESLSLWTGIRALLILGALLYGASALFLRDRDEKNPVFKEKFGSKAAREAEA